MIVSRLKLKNWRNFSGIDIPLRQRQFFVGPNASGKSNLLDVFRFLRDIAKYEGGGFQKAVKNRGGLSKLRCLAARRDSEITLEVELSETLDADPIWRYALGIKQEGLDSRKLRLSFEKVWKKNKLILDRPSKEDEQDPERLQQTFLEQINTNAAFREIARFFDAISYIHLVPQLLRHAEFIQGGIIEDDPFGQGLLLKIAKTDARTRTSRLNKIEEALKITVPQLQQLRFERDKDTGHPHLAALYTHWRPNAGWQQEDQFSDGTLRLIGLLWALLDSDSLLLLEEPELSLNSGIVQHLAPLIYRMQRQRKRQVLISTHSESLLSDAGIDGREVLLLSPRDEGSSAEIAADVDDVRPLLEAGLSVGEVVLPKNKPQNIGQLGLFE
ncbi:MAG: chromosome segregation protein SMC [Candidatus Electrothrix sp. ATG1]|nr:chromosome segregation protein SMC [Candidatus Electrothrix sp. ATG1]